MRVRSPQLLELAEVLMRHGIDVQAAPDGEQSLVVTGTDTARIGELAAGAGVVLHELALHRGSLEEAFMHITGHDVEYTRPVAAPTTSASPHGKVTAMSVIAAERIKLTSTRSPWWCAAFGVVATVGVGSISMSAGDDAGFSGVTSTQLGYGLGMAVVMVMATLAVTTEYSVGMIRTTFLAVPNRTVALLAKTVVVAVAAGLVGLLAAFGSWALGLVLLPGADLALHGRGRMAPGRRGRPGLPGGGRLRRRGGDPGPAHRGRGGAGADLGADGRAAARADPRVRVGGHLAAVPGRQAVPARRPDPGGAG